MHPNKKHIELLWNKFIRNEASRSELEELFAYVEAASGTDELFSFVDRQLLEQQPVNRLEAERKADILRDALRSGRQWSETVSSSGHMPLPEPKMRRIPFYRRWLYAAAVLLIVGTGAYFWLQQNPSQTLTHANKHPPADIEAGREGAILTLADGSTVVLDSLGNGVVATQNGAAIVLHNGQLAYDPTGKATAEMSYNTMTTPKGRQFSLVLSDGTKVWLNAATSLKFPTAFVGTERKVEVTGEAYFEVAKNAKMPFKVTINGRAEIEVLGTHFNVKAYADEGSIHTTLLEGSVKMVYGTPATDASPVAGARWPAVTLSPGQQAQLPVNQGAGQEITVVNNADTEKIMAWKNGLFNFNGSSLTEVTKQLERWYDIEVVYEKGVRDIELEGKMTRDVSLRGLLRILENLGVRAQLENRRLTLLP
ncbi:MAG: FecR family protein [Agriterribacter sp.]